MKKILFFFCAIALGLTTQAQLSNIMVEEFVHDGSLPTLTGHTTYRLFAQNAAAGDFVTEVTGEAGTCTSTVCSDGDWFNSGFAGNAGTNGNALFWGVAPDAKYDTYYTIGFSSSTTVGIPQAEDVDGDPNVGDTPTLSSAGVNTAGAWTGTFAAGASASCIVDITDAVGGAWFALFGDPNGFGVGTSNSVLLGQFTTNGAFSSSINVSVIDAGGLVTYTNCNDAAAVDNLIFPEPGCTNAAACNYNANADTDDGSCILVGDACDDGDAGTDNDVIQADCSCAGEAGLNDTCLTAEALTVDAAPVAGDNSLATNTEDGCLSAGAPDVWYSFDGTGGLVDIETFADGLVDSQIGIFDACGNAPLECDDDDGAGNMSLISGFCADAGTTYYVHVQGWNGAVGTFTISVVTSASAPATYCSDMTASNYNATPGNCDVEDNTTCVYPPANDECANATLLTVDAAPTAGDNTGANDENDASEVALCWGTDGADGDVWYSFMGTGGLVNVSTYDNDTQIAVYDACGGNEVACGEDEGGSPVFNSLITDLCTTAGTMYFIEVEGWNGNEGAFTIEVTTSATAPTVYCSDMTAVNYQPTPGPCDVEDNSTCTYGVCIDPTAINYDSTPGALDCAGDAGGTDFSCCIYPPANDTCAGAEALTIDGAAATGDNTLATNTEDGCLSAGAPDVWYSFMGNDGLVDIETFANGGMTDSQIGIFDGCGNAPIECDDDDGAGNMSLITGFCAEAGTTYYVHVQGWNGAVGSFDISVVTSGATPATVCDDPTATNFVSPSVCDIVDNTTCVYPALANDLFADAEAITMTNWPVCSPTAGTTVGATDSPESTFYDALYGGNYIDVWYEITPSWAGIKVDVTTGDLDMDCMIELYDAMGNFVAGADDNFFNTGEILFENIVAGDTYYISVIDFNNVGEDFTICAQNLVENALSSALWGDAFECYNNSVISSSWLPAGQATEWYFDDGMGGVTQYSASTQQIDLNDVGLEPGTYSVQVNNVYEGFEVDSRAMFSAGTVTLNGPSSALKGVYRDATVDLVPNALVRCIQGTACGWESFNWEITDADMNVSVINTPTDVLYLSDIPGITYEATYSTRVAVVYGGGVTGDYGDSYDFNTGGVPANKLKAQFNSSNTTLIPSQYIFAQFEVAGATDYTWRIQRTDISELAFEYMRGAPLRSARVSDMNLAEGGTYDIEVKAEVAGFTSVYGAVEEVTVIGGAIVFTDSDTTPIDLEEEAIKTDIVETGVTMYPNPANEFVTLNITGIEEGTDKVLVDIFNSVGQLVQSKQISAEGNYVSTVVTLDGLSEGMYNVQLTIGNTVTTERIVIQK